jgi:hypothetical protein
MIHIWPLHFFPESEKATIQIIEIIRLQVIGCQIGGLAAGAFTS